MGHVLERPALWWKICEKSLIFRDYKAGTIIRLPLPLPRGVWTMSFMRSLLMIGFRQSHSFGQLLNGPAKLSMIIFPKQATDGNWHLCLCLCLCLVFDGNRMTWDANFLHNAAAGLAAGLKESQREFPLASTSFGVIHTDEHTDRTVVLPIWHGYIYLVWAYNSNRIFPTDVNVTSRGHQ